MSHELRFDTWQSLDGQSFSRLPKLEDSLGSPEDYLLPFEDNPKILEIYLSSLTSGNLSQASKISSLPFVLAVWHLAAFFFGLPEKESQQEKEEEDKNLKKEAMIRSLLRSASRGMLQKEILETLIRCPACSLLPSKDPLEPIIRDSSILKTRLNQMETACGGEESLLKVVRSIEEREGEGKGDGKE